MALTDHDTVSGIEEAQASAKQLKVISGIEFSSLWLGRGIHVVGLNIDLEHSALQQALVRQQQARSDRATLIAQRLEKAGIPHALRGAEHYAGDGVIGRPHFAQYLIDAGYVDSFQQAFKRYLGAGKAGDVKLHWPSLETVVEWITEAKGVAVLAHPEKYDLTRTKLYQLVECFQQAGGEAIEVVSGMQEKSVTAKLARIAEDFKLLASTGSDFHSPDFAWQALGGQSGLPPQCRPVWEHF